MARRFFFSQSSILMLLFCAAMVTYTQYKLNSLTNKSDKSTSEQKQQTTQPKEPETVHLPASDTLGAVQHRVHKESNPVPDRAVLEAMTPVDLIQFFHGYITGTQILCPRRIRMGRVQDGGWDFCDMPGIRPDASDCLVYSFGINNDFSYDDAIEAYGCEVHAYDPSMAVEDHVRGNKIHFHKLGISGQNGVVERKGVKWTMYTLGSLRQNNGHSPSKRRVDIVKMDVEGAELAVLFTALKEGSLRDVNQLCFEMHIGARMVSKGNGDPKPEYLIQMSDVLRDLWSLGFRLYHTNRNVSPSQIYRSLADKSLRTVTHELHFLRQRHH